MHHSVFLEMAVLAGAVQVLAPDHWVPASILSWQRGWRWKRTATFALAAFLAHVLMGFGIFWLLNDVFEKMRPKEYLFFSIFLLVGSALARSLRMSRIREILRVGPRGAWGIFTVLSLLGPCETLIPVLLQARHLGVGYLLPSVGFFVGTCFSGILLVVAGRMIWNRPLWFTESVRWAERKLTSVPVAAGVLLGISLMLKFN